MFKKSDFALRWAKGIGAGSIGQGLTVGSRLILPPLFLHTWGVSLYGEWLLLTALAAYVAISDFGGGLYIVNRLTQEFAIGNHAGARKILHTGLWMMTMVPGLTAALFLAATWLLPIRHLLGIHTIDPDTSRIIVTILAIQIALSLPHGLLLGIFRAVGQLPRGVMLANIVQCSQLVCTATVLILGGGPIMVCIVQISPYLVVSVVAAKIINKSFPDLKLLSPTEAELLTARTLVRPSLHFFSLQMSQALSVQATVFVVGVVLGPTQAVVFVTMRTLCNSMKSVVALVSHAAWPDMTRFASKGDSNSLAAVFKIILRTTMVGSAGIIVLLVAFGDRIYSLWLGRALSYDPRLMTIFLALLFQQVFWTTCSHVLMAINNHHKLSWVILTSSLVAIGLAYAGGRMHGIRGLVTGVLLADVLLPMWAIPYLLNRYDSVFSGRFLLGEAIPPLITIILAAIHPLAGIVALVGLLMWWWRAARRVDRITDSEATKTVVSAAT